MPFSGTGIFSRVYQWTNDAANGLFVDATRTDTDSNDIASGLTNCVTRDGQSPATANIPLGGFKITGLANGALATDAVNYGQVFTNPTFVGLTATGTVNLTGGTVTVATQALGNNTTLAASTAFVIQQAFATALPAQSLGFLRSSGAAAAFTQTHTGYAQNEVKGADIASAATINLTTATGNLNHVTGTTGITAMTIPVGAGRSLIFDGILILTHSAGLSLPGGQPITTAAGDRADIRGDTAGAVVMNYTKADGRAVVSSSYELLAQATVGAPVANIDFLSTFSSTYDKYVVEVNGVLSSANDLLLFKAAKTGSVDAGANLHGSGAIPGISMSLRTSFSLSAGSGSNTSITIQVRNANDTVRPKSFGALGYTFNVSGPTYTTMGNEGVYLGANVMSGFRLTWNGGSNFTAGTVRVYGVKNT